MDKLVHARLEGQMDELLVRVKPELYRKHVMMNNDKKVLYIILRKALYGYVKSGFFFGDTYHQLRNKDLKSTRTIPA